MVLGQLPDIVQHSKRDSGLADEVLDVTVAPSLYLAMLPRWVNSSVIGRSSPFAVTVDKFVTFIIMT